MSAIVLAMTGASGAAYGLRLLEVLLSAGRSVHFTMSPAAAEVLRVEMNRVIDLRELVLADLLPGAASQTRPGKMRYCHFQDFTAGIASGSFPTDGMVICPCSMGTLGALAGGLSTNLIHSAAEVHLKERRKLVLMPRETPLSTIQLDNMHKLSAAGAVILPAMPGFYHQPQSIADLIDFVVGRICDQLGVDVDLTHRWGTG
ncbi:MAG: UbiX family flavin prenyltransferase [Planctomycetaceae bacterium]